MRDHNADSEIPPGLQSPPCVTDYRRHTVGVRVRVGIMIRGGVIVSTRVSARIRVRMRLRDKDRVRGLGSA